MPRASACVPRHIPSHTHASRWSLHGHVYGKEEWQAGCGFVWHQEKLHKVLFCKECHFQLVKENPCVTSAVWFCQSSKLPRVQPSAAPSLGAQRLAITDVQVVAHCCAPRARCEGLGARVREGIALCGLPETVLAAPARECALCL